MKGHPLIDHYETTLVDMHVAVKNEGYTRLSRGNSLRTISNCNCKPSLSEASSEPVTMISLMIPLQLTLRTHIQTALDKEKQGRKQGYPSRLMDGQGP